MNKGEERKHNLYISEENMRTVLDYLAQIVEPEMKLTHPIESFRYSKSKKRYIKVDVTFNLYNNDFVTIDDDLLAVHPDGDRFTLEHVGWGPPPESPEEIKHNLYISVENMLSVLNYLAKIAEIRSKLIQPIEAFRYSTSEKKYIKVNVTFNRYNNDFVTIDDNQHAVHPDGDRFKLDDVGWGSPPAQSVSDNQVNKESNVANQSGGKRKSKRNQKRKSKKKSKRNQKRKSKRN